MLGVKAALIGIPVVAGLAALMFSGRTANAAPGNAPIGGTGGAPGGVTPVLPPPIAPAGTAPGLGPQVPQSVVDEVAGALISADPTKINATADDLEAKGFGQQAQDLRAVAANLANAIHAAPLPPQVPQVSPGVPAVPPPGVALPPLNPPPGGGFFPPPPVVGQPPIILPPMVIPGTPPPLPLTLPSPAPVSDPRFVLAQQVAMHLATTKRGSENKALVSQFEQQEDQAGFIPDHDTRGLYGEHDALALANHWNIIPPAPFYWPANPTPAKAQFKAAMQAKAAQDPARAAAWLQVATASQYT